MFTHTITAPSADHKLLSYLFNNIDSVLKHRAEILLTDRFRNICIPGMYVAGLYIGMRQLSLGDMLNLWEKTEWKNGTKYYFSIIGSPLSGINTAHWYDLDSKQFGTGSYRNGNLGFMGLVRPALMHLRQDETGKHCNNMSRLSVVDMVDCLSRAR